MAEQQGQKEKDSRFERQGGAEPSEIQKEMAKIVKEREELRLKLSRKYYLEEVIPAKDMGKTVVYFPGSGISELAYAFEDVVPVAPSDNYAVFTCARRQQRKYIELAESMGLNQDICSYDRVAAGLMFANEGAFGPVPPPDLIIGQGNICETHSKYWEIVSDYFGNVPFFVFDQPSHLQRERMPNYAIEYGASQVRRALRFIAEHTGKKLDWDRFKEVMGLSIRSFTEYWENVVELRAAIPSPWSTVQSQNDAFVLSAYMGRPEAKQYFDTIAKEVKFRVEHKIGVNPNERFRLLYTDLPPWFQMNLMKAFHDRGGTLAFEAYPSILWLRVLFDKYNNIPPIYELDPEKPDEALAIRLFTMGSQRNHKQTVEGYVVATEKYHLDGAVFFTNRTCAQCTRAVPLKERQYRERTGKPTMMFQGEHCDERSFSESQTLAKMDAFFETLERLKSQRNVA